MARRALGRVMGARAALGYDVAFEYRAGRLPRPVAPKKARKGPVQKRPGNPVTLRPKAPPA